jgi:hypothetical protein
LESTEINGTILSDDIRVTVLPKAFYEGDETYTYSFSILQSSTAPSLATVSYMVSDGTALAGSDYNLLSPTTLTLSETELEVIIEIEILGDLIPEGDEFFTVTLLTCEACALGTSPEATITLFGDDNVIVFDFDSMTVVETEDTFDIEVTMSTTSPVNTAAPDPTVIVETVDGTALAGSDYIARVVEIVLPDGASTASFIVSILGDVESEADESFIIRFGNIVGLKSGSPDSVVVNIQDNDARLIRVSSERVREGGDARRFQEDVVINTMTFTVSLSGPAPANSSLNYTTEDGTAGADDYIPVAGVHEFVEGDLQFDIEVQILADFDEEETEHFWLRILSFEGDLKVDDETDGTGTIVNDDYKVFGAHGVVNGRMVVKNPII